MEDARMKRLISRSKQAIPNATPGSFYIIKAAEEVSKRQRLGVSFDFETDDPDMRLLVQQIRGDIALLVEMEAALENVKVPVSIGIESAYSTDIVVEMETYTASFAGLVPMTLTEVLGPHIYWLSELESMLPLFHKQTQLRVLMIIHACFQDDFMKMGRFNEVLQEWVAVTLKFDKKPTDKCSWKLHGSTKAAQTIVFDPQPKDFLGGWPEWLTAALPLIKSWLK
jgi:hypothetical protein